VLLLSIVMRRIEDSWVGSCCDVMPKSVIDGREHDQAQALLRSRYPQLERMQIAELTVIAVRIVTATSWGNLSLAKSY